jgi:hypothetical protein
MELILIWQATEEDVRKIVAEMQAARMEERTSFSESY